MVYQRNSFNPLIIQRIIENERVKTEDIILFSYPQKKIILSNLFHSKVTFITWQSN